MSKGINKSMIHYLIVIAFVFLFQFVPGFAGIQPQGMALLGTFIGAVYGWITLGMLWPSLIALLGVGFYLGPDNVMAVGFGGITFFSIVFYGPLVDVCNETGAFKNIIDKVLSSKLLQGKGYTMFWILFMMSLFLGFTNPVVICLIFCSFVTTICRQVGIEKNEKFPIFAYMGIALSAMIGQVMFPFLGLSLTLVMAYNAMFPGSPLDFVSYMAFMIPIAIFLVTLYTLLCKFIFRVDVSKLANFKPESKVEKLNRDQKLSLAVFLSLIVLMLASSLPLGPISEFLMKFDLFGIIVALLCVLGMLKKEDGTPLFNLEKGFSDAPWGVVLMVAYVMVMAVFLDTPETGISNGISALLEPFTSLPPLVFIVIAFAFTALLTNFANNMLVAILVMPFMYSFAALVDWAPTGMICLVFLLAQFAIATPAASPVAAVMMNQPLVEIKEVMKTAVKVVPIMFIAALIVGIAYVSILF